MNIDTWYYALSTISQTLAALLGLGAIFVVLRLQSLNKNISDYKSRSLNILRTKMGRITGAEMPEDMVMNVLIDMREFQENYMSKYRENTRLLSAVNYLAQTYEDRGHKSDVVFVNDTLKNLESFVSQRDGLVSMVKWPGLFISISIFLAMLSLTSTDYIVYKTSALWGITLFALFSLSSTVRASWKIIDAIKRLE